MGLDALRPPGRRAEAQTEARIVRRRAVYVTLASAHGPFEAGSPIKVSGDVRTRGGPRAGVPVGLFATTRHLETVVTDAKGKFEGEVWIDTLPGPLAITARTEADATGAYAISEARLLLSIVPARPLPTPWVLGAIACCVLVLAGVAQIRKERAPQEGGLADDGAPAGASIRPARPQGKRDRHRSRMLPGKERRRGAPPPEPHSALNCPIGRYRYRRRPCPCK